MKIPGINKLLVTRYPLLAIFLLTPFFNGSKDPAAIFIFETVIFILFFIISRFRKTDIDVPIFIFVIFAIFSTLNTFYFDSSINTVILLISYIIFFYCIISVYDEQFKKYFYAGLLSVSFILSLIIVIQTFLGITPKATMPNPNMAAGYITAGTSLVLSILILEKPKLKIMTLYCFLFLFFWLAIALTHSRGGLFSLICGIVAVLYFKFKKLGIIIFTVGLLVIFISIPKKTLTNITKTDGGDSYALKRPAIWKTAIEIIKEKPVFGTGPGNFELLFYKYNFPVDDLISRYSKNTRFAHNEFLQIAAEGGLFTLFAFLFILAVVFKNGIKSSPVSAVVLSSILGHSILDFNLHLPALVFVAIILSSDILYKNRGKVKRIGGMRDFSPSSMEQIHTNCSREFILGKLDKKYIRIFLAIILIFNTVNFFIKPFNAEKYKIIADKFIKTNPEKALEFYQKAVEHSPNNFEYRRIAGELFYDDGVILEAIKNLKKSIELNPKNPFAFISLSNIYYELSEFNKAEYYLLNSLDIEPNYLAAKYLLAKINEKQNKIESALKGYTDIISIYKFFSGEYLSSGYEKTLLSVDISSVYNSLGFLQMNIGKLTDAISNYNLSIKTNPENTQTYSNLASVYFTFGKNYSEALRYGKLAVFYADEQEKPHHLKNLILIYKKLGNQTEITKLEKIIKGLKGY
ncbi:MAG: O-antigen ligase family protein [Elusimicrobiota bacterium]|nr:O-antigen ligase family protein [Elusimicrobiota bacterium]